MIPDKIKGMMQKLIDNKFEAYIIGGAVRDYLMNNNPHDYDIFTNATGEKILKIFPDGNIIGGEERQEKILTVVVDDVEISQYRKNGDRTETGSSLSEHQETCDFTINALAMDIEENIIDISTGFSKDMGKRDIERKILRFVGNADDRINEDYLRLLRAIRFAAKYELSILVNTKQSIEKNAIKIKELPQERVRDELLKILQYPKGIEYLLFYGFLDIIFPEYEKVKGMYGGDFHNERVDSHMLNAFEESCKITDNSLLRLGIFLHDIGKGETQTFEGEICQDANGNETESELMKQTHFYEHEKVGCDLMEKRLEELKFSKDDIKYIATLIRLHMYSFKVKPGKKSYIKFFNNLDDAKIPIEDYIMMIYCDHQGNMAKPRIKFGDFIKGNWLYKKYYEIKYSEEPMTVKDLKVGGQDVIEILKIEPGPKIGEVLNELFEDVMDGEIKNTRADLLLELKAGCFAESIKTSKCKHCGAEAGENNDICSDCFDKQTRGEL